jgi:hypothetical protein
MTYLTSKKLIKKLSDVIGHEYVLGGISDETLELAIKLAQSIETDEERLARIKHFQTITEKAVVDAAKYNSFNKVKA